MEEREYEILYRAEHSHWWYKALHKQLLQTIHEISKDKTVRILDAGCGTGYFLTLVQQQHSSFGIDLFEAAIQFCAKRGLQNVARASVTQIPFADNSFDVAVSADVLYHKNVAEDRKALLEFYRILKPGGSVILNLPAFEFLRSTHDVAIHTGRRYRKNHVDVLLRSCGFQIDRLYYRNCLLFPIIAVIRWVRKGRAEIDSDVVQPSSLVNKTLEGIMSFDDSLAKRIPFPAGVSIFCVARKSNLSPS